jgi:hypothetical protein
VLPRAFFLIFWQAPTCLVWILAKSTAVHWQGRDLGWLADDLVIACTSPTGKRTAGISLKSDRQVTSGGFPPKLLASRGRNGSASRQVTRFATAMTRLPDARHHIPRRRNLWDCLLVLQ